jgi:hypothetical protein
MEAIILMNYHQENSLFSKHMQNHANKSVAGSEQNINTKGSWIKAVHQYTKQEHLAC